MAGFPELTIGEVARRAGVAASSIRYYERIGLLPEPDRSGGQRRYDADVLGKLGFIGVAQNAGFKLREIKRLLDGSDGLGAPMRSLSREKLGEVEALLEHTKAMKGWLEVAQECGCATPADCAGALVIGRTFFSSHFDVAKDGQRDHVILLGERDAAHPA